MQTLNINDFWSISFYISVIMMSFFVICGVDVCVCVWGSGPRGSTPPYPRHFSLPTHAPFPIFFGYPRPKFRFLPPPPPLAPAHLTPLPHFSSKAPHPHPLQNCCRSQIAMPHLVFSGTFPCYSQRSPGSTVFLEICSKNTSKKMQVSNPSFVDQSCTYKQHSLLPQ